MYPLLITWNIKRTADRMICLLTNFESGYKKPSNNLPSLPETMQTATTANSGRRLFTLILGSLISADLIIYESIRHRLKPLMKCPKSRIQFCIYTSIFFSAPAHKDITVKVERKNLTFFQIKNGIFVIRVRICVYFLLPRDATTEKKEINSVRSSGCE